MNKENIKVVAFDLDGTLTQHKTKLSLEHREVLFRLAEKYKLLMAGAGMCRRIFEQMDHFPVDILGNYGMQYALYRPEQEDIEIVENITLPCNKESVEARVTMLREKYGFTEFAGNNVEYHASGAVTFPILGTKAKQEDKLAFDPDRSKRRAIYEDVKQVFNDYIVFVGGSSSFDMTPAPYSKGYALEKYCQEHGLTKDQVCYVGDDYGPGGNDESVLLAGFPFIKIDDYHDFPKLMEQLL